MCYFLVALVELLAVGVCATRVHSLVIVAARVPPTVVGVAQARREACLELDLHIISALARR